MIDLRALRENPEPFRASQRARGADVDLVDRVIAADETRRQALAAFENLRAEQKQVSRSVGKASPEERPAILANAKELAEQVKAAEAASSADTWGRSGPESTSSPRRPPRRRGDPRAWKPWNHPGDWMAAARVR